LAIWPKECHWLAPLLPSSGHTTVASFGTAESGSFFNAGWPMDSLQSPPNNQRNRDNIDPSGTAPTAVKDRPAGLTGDPDFWYASPTIAENVDPAAEETCPAPGAEPPARNELPQPAPAIQPAQAPSAAAFELMDQLEALASDLAGKERASSGQNAGPPDPGIGKEPDPSVGKESENSSRLPAVEPTIRVSPRPSGFESGQFAVERPSIGRRTSFILAGLAAVALIGVGVAWQSQRASTTPPGVDATAELARSAPAAQIAATSAPSQPAPVTQTAASPPPASPELGKQLEAMSQDLASVRRGIEQLTAKQEQLAAAQQQLEQLAAKQEQLAAKQEQMAQNIAKLQAPREQTGRPRVSAAAPQPRLTPAQPRTAPEPPPPPQVSAAPRPESHPVPPLPVPR
jgi:hypothetical protein